MVLEQLRWKLCFSMDKSEAPSFDGPCRFTACARGSHWAGFPVARQAPLAFRNTDVIGPRLGAPSQMIDIATQTGARPPA